MIGEARDTRSLVTSRRPRGGHGHTTRPFSAEAFQWELQDSELVLIDFSNGSLKLR